jgi:Xaa-Pro aminopeptidase
MDFLSFRRGALLDRATDDAVDAYLVTHPANVAYLTGGRVPGWLLVAAKGVILVTDHPALAADLCPDLPVHPVPAGGSSEQAVAAAAGKLGGKAVGVDPQHLSAAALTALTGQSPKLAVKPVGPRLEAIRTVKHPAEVEEIRATARVAARAVATFAATLRESDTEADLVGALEGYARRSGARAFDRPTTVLVGERGAIPGAPPGCHPLIEGSKLLLDFSPVVQYACRVTRVVRSPFAPAMSRKTKRERVGHDLDAVAEVVGKARSAAVAAVKDGVPVREVDAAARAVLQAGGLGEYTPAVLVHGTGLEAVEAPVVTADSKDKLEIGMVLTIAPGVHIPGWGGVRASDCVVVGRDRCISLMPPAATPAAWE